MLSSSSTKTPQLAEEGGRTTTVTAVKKESCSRRGTPTQGRGPQAIGVGQKRLHPTDVRVTPPSCKDGQAPCIYEVAEIKKKTRPAEQSGSSFYVHARVPHPRVATKRKTGHAKLDAFGRTLERRPLPFQPFLRQPFPAVHAAGRPSQKRKTRKLPQLSPETNKKGRIGARPSIILQSRDSAHSLCWV